MGIVRTISEHFIQIKYFQVKYALMQKARLGRGQSLLHFQYNSTLTNPLMNNQRIRPFLVKVSNLIDA